MKSSSFAVESTSPSSIFQKKLSYLGSPLFRARHCLGEKKAIASSVTSFKSCPVWNKSDTHIWEPSSRLADWATFISSADVTKRISCCPPANNTASNRVTPSINSQKNGETCLPCAHPVPPDFHSSLEARYMYLEVILPRRNVRRRSRYSTLPKITGRSWM